MRPKDQGDFDWLEVREVNRCRHTARGGFNFQGPPSLSLFIEYGV